MLCIGNNVMLWGVFLPLQPATVEVIIPLKIPFFICLFAKESGKHSRSGRGNPDGLCELAGESSGPSTSDTSSTVSSSGSSLLQDERLLRIAQQAELLKNTLMVKSGEVKNHGKASYVESKPLTLDKSEPDTTSPASSLLRIPTPQTRKVNDIISHLQGKSFTEENNQSMSATNSKPHPNQYVLPVHVSWNTQGLYMKLIAEAVSNLL